jgi:arylsulfatase A-like enzyme
MEGYDYSSFRKSRKERRTDAPDSAYIQCIHAQNQVNKPWRAVVTADGWKYVCFPGCSWLMFDLNSDPYEMHNMAHDTKRKARRQELIARMKKWVADTGDDFDVPED